METPSELITQAFTTSFLTGKDTDLNLIEQEFQQVLKTPLKYPTFRIKRVSDGHNEYRYDTEMLIGSKNFDIDVLKIYNQGVYTIFSVYSESPVEVKRQVTKVLENHFIVRFRDILSDLPKNTYYVIVKHIEYGKESV